MSFRNQRPQSRRTRRQQDQTVSTPAPISPKDVPGPLRFLTNPKLFLAMGLIFAAGIVLSIFSGILFDGSTASTGGPMQANEAADVPRDATGATATPGAAPTATVTVKRYTSPPEMTIDPTKKYTATIKTTQGDIQVELDPSSSPEAVNAFVFLARESYYNNTPFMQVNPEATKFTAQAGDPTQTGLGTPGFTINERPTTKPFVRGAFGYDSGQFYISYGDYPALSGKETIIGQVTSGLDVLDRLNLLNVKQKTSGADQVQSVVITES